VVSRALHLDQRAGDAIAFYLHSYVHLVQAVGDCISRSFFVLIHGLLKGGGRGAFVFLSHVPPLSTLVGALVLFLYRIWPPFFPFSFGFLLFISLSRAPARLVDPSA
jgi:hypothetical protein